MDAGAEGDDSTRMYASVHLYDANMTCCWIGSNYFHPDDPTRNFSEQGTTPYIYTTVWTSVIDPIGSLDAVGYDYGGVQFMGPLKPASRVASFPMPASYLRSPRPSITGVQALNQTY